MEKIKEKLEKIQEIVREGFPSYPLMTGEAVWQLATEALALIDEMSKTGVWVEIPEPDLMGYCNLSCRLLDKGNYNDPFDTHCSKKWGMRIGVTPLHVGPGCPRFKGEPNDQTRTD
jgi:hypothetical protein